MPSTRFFLPRVFVLDNRSDLGLDLGRGHRQGHQPRPSSWLSATHRGACLLVVVDMILSVIFIGGLANVEPVGGEHLLG